MFLKKISYISGGNFASLKNKKINSEEISYISPKNFADFGMTDDQAVK